MMTPGLRAFENKTALAHPVHQSGSLDVAIVVVSLTLLALAAAWVLARLSEPPTPPTPMRRIGEGRDRARPPVRRAA